MAKLNVGRDESSSFKAAYRSTGGDKKELNKISAEIHLNSDDPRRLTTTITSVNFGAGEYPNNAKHT